MNYLQAASGLQNLKMVDSPAKKINFEPVGKENLTHDIPVVDDEIKKSIIEPIETKEKAVDLPKVALTIKSEEANEPLLQENPHRFVLFPIKYHEVRGSDASRVKCYCPTANIQSSDLANVQEGRSVILDRRGN